MKVTVETDDLICTVEETKETEEFEHLFDLFRQASLGVGYGTKTVEEYMNK
jgi:hypothetical protein